MMDGKEEGSFVFGEDSLGHLLNSIEEARKRSKAGRNSKKMKVDSRKELSCLFSFFSGGCVVCAAL